MDDPLQALQAWYAQQCNGDWEHRWGVEITTLDNPGWRVQIDLVGTALEGRDFKSFTEPVNALDFPGCDRWLDCSIKDDVWQGAGDETKLTPILQTFLAWANSQ